jgi:hypothetical protein
MRIEPLRKYQRRGRDGFYFTELLPSDQEVARRWLRRFVDRYRHRNNGRPVPPWLFAIYVGQAKRLTMHPPSSDWGRRMLARKGGLAVQRQYRLEGRDAIAIANRVRLVRGTPAQLTDKGCPQAPKRRQVTPIIIRGQSDPHIPPGQFAKKVAERIEHILSCDDRFYSIAVGSHVSGWEWEIMIAGVPLPY